MEALGLTGAHTGLLLPSPARGFAVFVVLSALCALISYGLKRRRAG